MNATTKSSSLERGISIFTLLFIFSPILSTQPEAQPGALYVIALVIPIFIMALRADVIKPRIITLYACLLFAFALFSTLISDLGSLNLRMILKYFLFIVLFISLSSFVIPPKQLRISFKLYLYLSIVLAILILLSYVFGFQHIEATHSQGRYSIGITGLYKNPNYLASFFNVAFFVICYILVTVKLNFKKKIVLFFILALFLVAGFLTGTRAALLIEILILLIMPIVLAKSGRFYLVIPLVIIVSAVIFYYFEEINTLLSLFLGNRDAFSDEGRSEAWAVAFKYIQSHPIFGCGHNSWSTISNGSSYLEYLHNIFLELVLDQGVVGLLLAIGIIFTGYRKTNINDRTFLRLFLFVTAFPMFFQNGLYEVNFWRFIIINRLMMNVSSAYEGGITAFLNDTYCVKKKVKKGYSRGKVIVQSNEQLSSDVQLI